VLSADNPADTRASDSLTKLCQAYWYPLYVYVRRRGYSHCDAQDLTQEFFARLLEKHFLSGVDRSKGKFRTYLLAAMEHFLANEWNRAHMQKRGGGYEFVPLEASEAEGRYVSEPTDATTPEKLFERHWAVALLDQVLDRLGSEYQKAGKAALFEQLKGLLGGDKGAQPYAVIGAKLEMTEGAVKVAVHRLRQRYRELTREKVAETLGSPDDVDEELRHLFMALSG
jgi:RNA polymerase sigma-70 factor (ECF subfamily)